MVSRQDKNMMKDFVTARLEDAQRYNILQADESHILLSSKPEVVEKPAELYIVLHNSAMTLSDYKKLSTQQLNKGRYFSNIFYKNDEDFMVRLGWRGNTKGNDRSLKLYDKPTIDSMIHLRGLEKLVLGNQNIRELAYYQPNTQRLEESIRRYNMNDVTLDYSHIPEEDRKYDFVKNRVALDYKIAQEVLPGIQSGQGIRFKKAHGYKNIVAIIPA